MSKTAISKAIRTATGCTVAQADEAVDALVATILDGVKTEGHFRMIGFGTFSKSERPARQGRNPRTGKTIEISASSTIKFKASSSLKK
jgi:DNA-binding protein HU-beta